MVRQCLRPVAQRISFWWAPWYLDGRFAVLDFDLVACVDRMVLGAWAAGRHTAGHAPRVGRRIVGRGMAGLPQIVAVDKRTAVCFVAVDIGILGRRASCGVQPLLEESKLSDRIFYRFRIVSSVHGFAWM